jgi:hypothetical protein
VRIHLDHGQAALLRYVHDRRHAPSSALLLLIERRISTFAELTALLHQLADLGLIEIDVVESLPAPSITKAGQAWLYGHFHDLR